MKVAITSSGKDLTSETDPRFGRAKYFIVADTETMDFDVIENTQNLELPQGAGIQAGKTILNNGAEALITGHCGPKAFKVLRSGGVNIFVGVKGSVREVIELFKKGGLLPAEEADVEGHWI